MNFLDLILIIFLITMFFVGISKGFFATLYDLVSFIFIVIFIYFNAGTFSQLIQIYHPSDDPLSQLGGAVINMVIVGLILFILLEILRHLIGAIIKPLLDQLTEHFAITSMLNHLLGGVLYVLKGFFMSFAVILLILVPLFGQEQVNHSQIAHFVLEDVPLISQSFLNEASAYGSLLKGADSLRVDDRSALKNMVIANDNAYSHHILDEEDAVKFIETQIGPALMKYQITLSSDEKKQFIELLNKTSYSDADKQLILNNIMIGSE